MKTKLPGVNAKKLPSMAGPGNPRSKPSGMTTTGRGMGAAHKAGTQSTHGGYDHPIFKCGEGGMHSLSLAPGKTK